MAGSSDIRAGRAYVELYIKNSALMKGLKEIQAHADKISQTFLTMGAQVAKVGVAMGLPIALATKRFADFDDQMREVKAVSQSTDAQFKQLTATAKNLGATTSFTAVEVAGIMAELGRAGFTADQIDKMTASVLNLARATKTDAVLSSGIMAATVRQFGLNAEDAARVADGLTAAANMTFNSVEQIGEALSYVGPVAASMNMTLEETLALIGGLGNVGIQGSEAGTALRRLLTISAAEAEKMNEIFGVNSIQAVGGDAKKLVAFLEEVGNATKNLGTAARASKFNEAFGLLGITGANVISKNAGSIRDLQTAIEGATGAASKTAAEMDAGLGGSLRILLSAVESVALAIGNALAPTLQEIGSYLIPIIQMFGQWINDNKGAVVAITGVVAGLLALGSGLLAVGGAAAVLSFAAGGLAMIGSAIGAVAGFIATVASFTPLIVAAGLAIGGVYMGLNALTGAFPEVSAGAKSMGSAVGGVFSEIGKWFSDNFGNILTTFQATWTGIVEAVNSGDLEGALEVMWAGVNLVFQENTQSIYKYWLDTKFNLQSVWADLTGGIVTAFTEAYAAIRTGWAETSAFIETMADAALNGGFGADAIAEKRKEALGQIAAEREAALADQDAKQGQLLAQYNSDLAAKEKALSDARRALDDSIDNVRKKANAKVIIGDFVGDANDTLDPSKYRSGSLDVGNPLGGPGAAALGKSVFGTFSATAAALSEGGVNGIARQQLRQAVQMVNLQQLAVAALDAIKNKVNVPLFVQ